MKNIKNWKKFNESSTDNIQVSLEKIFKILSNPKVKGDSSFEVEVVYNEFDTEIECYVNIDLEFSEGDEFTSEEMSKVYELVEQADEYVKSINGKLGNIILSNEGTGDEVKKSSLAAAKAYTDKKGITSIRVWFDIKVTDNIDFE